MTESTKFTTRSGKPCPKCGETMTLRVEALTNPVLGQATRYEYWECACGHEEPTAATYRKEHGED